MSNTYGGGITGGSGGTERMIKAHRLYTHLRARGIKAEHLDTMHPNILAHHVASAGVGTPDDPTLAMVHQMLSQPVKPVT